METYYCLIEDATGYILQKPHLTDDFSPGAGESVESTTNAAVYVAWNYHKWNGSTFIEDDHTDYQAMKGSWACMASTNSINITPVVLYTNYKLLHTTGAHPANNGFSHANNRLTLTDDNPGWYDVTLEVVGAVGTSYDRIFFQPIKNTSTLFATTPLVIEAYAATRYWCGSMHTRVFLEKTDYIEVFGANFTAGNDFAPAYVKMTISKAKEQ